MANGLTQRIKSKKAAIPSDELKAAILSVARRHFATLGFQGASLKNIAQESGVANSLINYHFTDKEGLFRACIELFARSRLQAMIRILAEPRNVDELRVRLELFVEEMIVSVIADPYGFEILDHEIRAGNPMILQLFQETLLKGFQTVVRFFEKAQKIGLIDSELDPFIVAVLLFSSTCDSTRKDFLGKAFFNISLEQSEYREKFTRHVVTLFLKGVMK